MRENASLQVVGSPVNSVKIKSFFSKMTVAFGFAPHLLSLLHP